MPSFALVYRLFMASYFFVSDYSFLQFNYQVHGLPLSQAVLSPLFSCRDIVLLLVFIHFRICGFQKLLKIRVLCAAYRRTEGRGITQLTFCRFQ